MYTTTDNTGSSTPKANTIIHKNMRCYCEHPHYYEGLKRKTSSNHTTGMSAGNKRYERCQAPDWGNTHAIYGGMSLVSSTPLAAIEQAIVLGLCLDAQIADSAVCLSGLLTTSASGETEATSENSNGDSSHRKYRSSNAGAYNRRSN